MTEEDMVILIRAYEAHEKLVEAFNKVVGIADCYGTGIFRDIEELGEVIINNSAKPMKESFDENIEPLGYFILNSSYTPEAKAELLLGKRFYKKQEE